MPGTHIPEGRLDILAKELLKRGVEMHGNPALELTLKLFEGPVNQAITEGLGPNSAAGKLAVKFVKGATEIDTRVRNAQAEIEREKAARR